MAIYYVSPYGSDTNNGLGPDPTAATNKPLKTINKALGNSSPKAAAGDTVYIAPGVYREAIQQSVSGTAGNPITTLGDPGNAQGFKDGSGVLVPPGEVRWGWVAANDTTQPTAGQATMYCSRSYLSFSNIWFIGYGNAGSVMTLDGATNVSFTSCMFTSVNSGGGPGSPSISTNNYATATVMNLTWDRCIFVGHYTTAIGLALQKTSIGSADYSANVAVKNSLFLGGSGHIAVSAGGAGTYSGGGVTASNCTFLANSGNAVSTGTGVSTTVPVAVYNSVFSCGQGNSLSATTAGQIVEDYNLLFTTFNVALPTHSATVGTCAPLLDFGQALIWGQSPRPIATPTLGSPLLGFGNAAGAPSYDFLGRARPEGGKSLASGLGYLERHDTAVQETSIVDSGTSIRIDGPGSHEFLIPVDATSTTISVKCYFDANYGVATPPQAVLVAVPEIGVAAQTVTAPATAGQWLTLTFSAITPNARGVVRVQLVAKPSTAAGKAYFDTFSVA